MSETNNREATAGGGYAAMTGELYDTHSANYLAFVDVSYGWRCIERPAIDEMLQGRWAPTPIKLLCRQEDYIEGRM